MLKQNSYTLLIIIMIFLTNLIQLFTLIDLNNLSSIAFQLSFLISVILFFDNLIRFNKKRNMNSYNIIIIIIITLLIVFSSLFLNEIHYIDYLFKYIYFVQFLMFIFILYNQPKIDKYKIKKALNLSVNIQLISFIIFYVLFKDNYYSHIDLLHFNYTHSNLTGMVLFLLICIKIYFMFYYIEKKCLPKTIINIILLVSSIFFLYETGNRSSLLAFITFVFLIFIFQWKKLISKKYIVISILTMLPFLVLLVYYTINNTFLKNYFDFMISEGKDLNSRTSIWNEAINVFLSNPIVGDYYYIVELASFPQMHNMYLDVFATYGFFVGCLFIYIMYGLIKEMYFKSNKKNWCFPLAFIGAIMVISGFEGGLLGGLFGLNILIYALILIL